MSFAFKFSSYSKRIDIYFPLGVEFRGEVGREEGILKSENICKIEQHAVRMKHLITRYRLSKKRHN